MRPRPPLVLAAAAALVAAVTTALVAVPALAGGAPLPERLPHVGDSRQVIVATASGWSTSHARLQAWQKGADGSWRRVLDPVPARIGWNGFALEANRRQGSGETPAGTFRLLRGFGTERPAGVDLRYRVIDGNDWWPYDPKDPKTYNVFQFRRSEQSRWRPSWAEDLDSYRKQYRYAVVLDYNLPHGIRSVNGQRVAAEPADTAMGGGIFLHVRDDGPTAGCVAVRRADMRRLLRWLEPSDQPVIVMGPRDVIERM
ncbi:MAG: L,D-transpeptidase family protein [Actinomycetota bacterium]|nr:L,D-transpeptidase family protein [Actinomycetota bacterium]